MPFESEKQRRWMHANKPEMAMEWERKYPQRGQRAKTNKQTQMAQAIRKHKGGKM